MEVRRNSFQGATGTQMNKVALVTGASSGIGRAVALAFAAAGDRVVLGARRAEQGEETAHLIAKNGGDAVFVRCDVRTEEDIRKLVETAVKRWNRLDYACNNAGIEGAVGKYLVDYPVEAWDEVIDINLKGVWLSMKHEVPAMLASGGGSVVNISSVAGLIGSKGNIAYFASKHGVVGLTRAAAMEYATSNIRVNVVCPGVIETPMAERFFKGREHILPDIHPMKRLGKPEEIADVVVWLCSDKASFITGHALPADGGFVAQ